MESAAEELGIGGAERKGFWLAVVGLLAIASWGAIDHPSMALTAPEQLMTDASTPSSGVDQELAGHLQQLRDEKRLASVDVDGTTCQQLVPAAAESAFPELVPVQNLLRGLAMTETPEVGAQILQEVVDRAGPTSLAAYIATQRLVSLQLRTGELASAGMTLTGLSAWPAPVEDCYRSDTLYLLGRLDEKHANSEASLASYIQARNLNDANIPAHLRLIEIGMRRSADPELARVAIVSLLEVGPFRGARNYAAQLVRALPSQSCTNEACMYLRAILLQWANLEKPLADQIQQAIDYCAIATCDETYRAALQAWRDAIVTEAAP